jgi:hypothetical protein
MALRLTERRKMNQEISASRYCWQRFRPVASWVVWLVGLLLMGYSNFLALILISAAMRFTPTPQKGDGNQWKSPLSAHWIVRMLLGIALVVSLAIFIAWPAFYAWPGHSAFLRSPTGRALLVGAWAAVVLIETGIYRRLPPFRCSSRGQPALSV